METGYAVVSETMGRVVRSSCYSALKLYLNLRAYVCLNYTIERAYVRCVSYKLSKLNYIFNKYNIEKQFRRILYYIIIAYQASTAIGCAAYVIVLCV